MVHGASTTRPGTVVPGSIPTVPALFQNSRHTVPAHFFASSPGSPHRSDPGGMSMYSGGKVMVYGDKRPIPSALLFALNVRKRRFGFAHWHPARVCSASASAFPIVPSPHLSPLLAYVSRAGYCDIALTTGLPGPRDSVSREVMHESTRSFCHVQRVWHVPRVTRSDARVHTFLLPCHEK